MKPVYQTRFGGSDAPPEEQGNCIAACLASIFEVSIESVPDLHESNWWDVLINWSQQFGVTPIYISPVKSVLFPNTFYVLGVKSRTLANPEDGHAVVAWGNTIVHDPNSRSTKGEWNDYEPQDATMFLRYWPQRESK